MDFLLEPLAHGFVRRALMAGVALAVAAGFLGTFVVQRGLAVHRSSLVPPLGCHNQRKRHANRQYIENTAYFYAPWATIRILRRELECCSQDQDVSSALAEHRPADPNGRWP